MATLIYTAIMSLDGFIEDAAGRFDWAMPSDEAHAFINDRERPVGTYLYGRRMYQTMVGWETDPNLAGQSPITRDYEQIWQSADKVVYSTTLESATTARTRIEREFDPDAIRRMKAALRHNLTIGGPNLAGHAFEAGLIDECHLYLAPLLVGGGKPALPKGVRLPLELVEQRRFDDGMVYLHYRCLPS